MEELQDAIEDAQYVNAISSQDYGPRPVLAWPAATDEQLAEWKDATLQRDSAAFSLEWTCASAIGMFLFSSYLKSENENENDDDYCHNDYVRINFCEQVIRWKKLRGKHRIEKAREIIATYLQPPKVVKEEVEEQKEDSAGGGGGDDDKGGGNDDEDPQRQKPGTLPPPTAKPTVVLPPKTEIDEYDLARTMLPPSRRLSPTVVADLCDAHMDESGISKESCVGLYGSVLAEINNTMRAAESQRKSDVDTSTSSSRTITSMTDTTPPLSTTEHDNAEQEGSESKRATNTTSDVTTTDTAAASPDKKDPPTVAKPDDEAGAATDKQQDTLTAAAAAATTAASQAVVAEKVSESNHSNSNNKDDPRFSSSLQKQLSKMNIDRRQSRARKYLPDDLFDKAEAIVMESLRRQYWNDFVQSTKYKQMENFLWYGDKRVVPEDFFILRVLGRGGFGLVTACKKGTSGKLYAMKVMNKRRIKMKKSEQLALNERAALAAVESPFVVNLKYSFHSKDDIFLILDLMTGGDLGYHLHQKGRFPKKECLYYAARIMLGLQALHDHRFVYRDLKPENCLLADDGRVRITDLGLATKITPTLHGAAGTRGYWAPEMLRRDAKGKRMPYGHTVDWFSFGCCLAEFIAGQNPFRSEEALKFGLAKGKQGKEKAIDCATLEMNPEYDPRFFDADAADLCRRLLEKDETKRLGTNGCEEIMVHPWFKDVNWEMILSDRKKPPFVPPKDVNAASQSEIGNFAEDKTYQETVIEEKDEDVYKDWDWTNPHAFAAEVIEFLIYERETGEPLIPLSQQSSCCCTIL